MQQKVLCEKTFFPVFSVSHVSLENGREGFHYSQQAWFPPVLGDMWYPICLPYTQRVMYRQSATDV